LRNTGSKKNKLIICGESFSYGTGVKHWPRIVSDFYDSELVNLAIVGCSNYAICFQLQHALNTLSSDDFVIISLTAAERFEIDDDEFTFPVSIEDFRQNIDEIKYSPFSKSPTITSGNLSSQLRNYQIEQMKKYLMSSSYRLSAQYQSWCLQHLISSLPCDYLLYRNIYPRYHEHINKYSNEYYFGLESYLVNSGPYDYEKEHVKTTNHLSDKENKMFADKVIKDMNGT
tara:strand:+ start:578 stop:1264 length:687 start_codon:yes stop_codon:yes gene_type:complete